MFINGQTANISGLGRQITIIGGNTSLCEQQFSPSAAPGEDAGNALWFGTSSIVHVILQRSYVA